MGRMIPARRFLPLLCCLLGVTGAFAGTGTIELGVWGRLQVQLPEGWKATTQPPEADGGSAMRIRPDAATPLELLMTPVPVTGDEEAIAQALRDAVEEAAKGVKETSVEKDLPIRELAGAECQTLYFTATDRTVENPTGGDFKYLTQGAASVGRFLVTFTILTNLP